jgi:hypothetical protein
VAVGSPGASTGTTKWCRGGPAEEIDEQAGEQTPVVTRPNPNPNPGTGDKPSPAAGLKMIGGAFGGDIYREVGPDVALLVGLEVGVGKFFDIDVARAVRPVFRAGDKESSGTQRGTDLSLVTRLVARSRYAVGAMTVKAGANADGLSLTFMRIKGAALDPKDSYESDWVGDDRPGGPRSAATVTRSWASS